MQVLVKRLHYLCGYNIIEYTFADIDECASTPCENDATCKDGVNSYTCECKDGFTGKNCEQSKCGKKRISLKPVL